MNVNRLGCLAVVVAILGGLSSVRAVPLGTAFIYQGQLKQDGSPVSGAIHLKFSLWDAAGAGVPPVGGLQVGATQLLSNIPAVNGMFTVTLNAGGEFGANAFTGQARWLQVENCNDPACASLTVLSPRQPITAAPYARHALSAGNGHALDSADGSPANVVFVDNIGNVGIGTTAPANKFAVVGNANVSGNLGVGDSTPANRLSVSGDADVTGSIGIGTTNPGHRLDVNGRMRARQGGETSAGIWFYQGAPADDRAFIGMQDDDHVGFYGTDGAGWGLTMDVSNGNVGVGTSTPAVPLHVVGGVDSSPGGGGYLVTGSTTGLNIAIDDNEIMARNNGQVATLTINNNGGDIVFGGAIDIGYQIIATSMGCPTCASAEAQCPPGKSIIGGGCTCGNGYVYDSYPSDNAWKCTCSGGGARAYAICANVK